MDISKIPSRIGRYRLRIEAVPIKGTTDKSWWSASYYCHEDEICFLQDFIKETSVKAINEMCAWLASDDSIKSINYATKKEDVCTF